MVDGIPTVVEGLESNGKKLSEQEMRSERLDNDCCFPSPYNVKCFRVWTLPSVKNCQILVRFARAVGDREINKCWNARLGDPCK